MAAQARSLRLGTRGAVAWLSLDRPPVSALDETALAELEQAVEQVAGSPALRVLVVCSALAGSFCAGGDLKYWPRA